MSKNSAGYCRNELRTEQYRTERQTEHDFDLLMLGKLVTPE